jgi:Do/DeqQ family serine protease
VPNSQIEIQLGFAPLVKQAAPAVVNIYAKQIVEARQNIFQNDPFFQGFFKDFAEARPRVQNSLGSGVILSNDGIVVTNYHVVGQSTDIRVVLADRREYRALVLLSDEDSDLAILQLIDTPETPFLLLRDSDGVEVGELALAIGNPFGVGQTVSSGIISGLARSGAVTGSTHGYFIQTDAPINPGNSGGALIDVQGNLIGINTSILTRSGGSNGIGFAIPANLVAQFVVQARQGNKRFLRPWAGMNGQSVDNDLAESLGLSIPGGIVISDMHAVSPFLAAGFLAGDVILAVDGQPVNTPAEMVFRMSVVGLGTTARITRFRQGETEDIAVALLIAPDLPAREVITTDRRAPIPALVLANINPAVLAEYGLPLGISGVVVVDPGPVGQRIGLKAGDILRGINREKISSTGHARAVFAASGRWVSLDVQRGLQRLSMKFRR